MVACIRKKPMVLSQLTQMITTPVIDNRLLWAWTPHSLIFRHSLSVSDNQSEIIHYWLFTMRWSGQHFYSVNFNLNLLDVPSVFCTPAFLNIEHVLTMKTINSHMTHTYKQNWIRLRFVANQCKNPMIHCIVFFQLTRFYCVCINALM
jgi:hypothetical protein